LEQQKYAPATINLRLAAVRRVAYEAADSGLLSPELAAGIRRVKGVRLLNAELFANKGGSCRIKCEQGNAVCDAITLWEVVLMPILVAHTLLALPMRPVFFPQRNNELGTRTKKRSSVLRLCERQRMDQENAGTPVFIDGYTQATPAVSQIALNDSQRILKLTLTQCRPPSLDGRKE